MTVEALRPRRAEENAQSSEMLAEYMAPLRAFLDDGPDLSRTMAALDRGLTRGERAMQWLDHGCALLGGVRRRFGSWRGREAA